MEFIEQIPTVEKDSTEPVVLKWNDALVAGVALGNKYVVTSPNMTFIPEPPSGNAVVRVKTDRKFGKEDPLNWPQLFADDPRVDFLSCIPRHTCPTQQSATWTTPDLTDYVEYETGNELKMFTLRIERLGLVDDAVDWLTEQLNEYECDHGDTPELRRLVVCAQLARDRLSHPGTQRDLLQQLVCVERHYCMALGWITWRRCTEDLSLGTNVAPADASLMGCLTTRADVAGRLAQAGIPVWFMRQSYELVGSCHIIMNVVELTTPTDFSTENRPASTNLYEGLPGINQLLAIYRQGHVCADVEAIPLPQDYASTPSDNTPVPNNENPTANRTNTTEGGPSRRDRPASASARAVPYPAPSVDRGRLVKFTVPEHENIPDMVQAWRTAVRNTLPPHNKSKSPWGYFVPEASMLTAPHKKETRELYLMNWLKIRVDWLLMMMDDKHRHLTTSSGWREYLAFCDSPRKEKHANVLRKMKEVWNIYSKDLARRASKWGGRELRVEDLDLRTWREITWELCQIGFRYELWALDSIIVRREGPHALDIAAERNRWINEVCGDDWLTRTEEQLTGTPKLGANTINERSVPLEALCRLMQAWPNKPEELAEVQQPLDDAGLERVESAAAHFYVLTFVRHAGRPPTIPRNAP